MKRIKTALALALQVLLITAVRRDSSLPIVRILIQHRSLLTRALLEILEMRATDLTFIKSFLSENSTVTTRPVMAMGRSRMEPALAKINSKVSNKEKEKGKDKDRTSRKARARVRIKVRTASINY